ncbi:MAG: hypothetical protein IJR88_06015 [Clostridia bacterium]|nr:hypothetical protein [Clostridia bacterium]
MFGYLRVDAENLRLRDYDCYKALYCGLCKSMGHCTGQCSRIALSYDFTFLAALRMTLAAETPEQKPFHCAVKCFRKHKAFVHSKELDFCADASAILNHYKLLDDRSDEKGLKKLRAHFGLGFFHRGYRKARRRQPELDALVKAHMEELSKIEKEKALASADRPAECFGKLLGEIASYRLPSPADRIARTIGCSMGKWIYLIDAADDYEEDKKRGRYNPFLTYEEGLNEAGKEDLKEALTAYLAEAEKAFDLIDNYPAPEFEEILKNLLYLGLPKTSLRILFRKDDRKDRT